MHDFVDDNKDEAFDVLETAEQDLGRSLTPPSELTEFALQLPEGGFLRLF